MILFSSFQTVAMQSSVMKDPSINMVLAVFLCRCIRQDVSRNDEFDLANLKETVKRDLTKHCPVHNKAHSLLESRAFRKKSLIERKNLLKEHKRCFECCSLNHVARECLPTLKCAECDSDRHCTVMHPDIVLSFFLTPVQEPKMEQQDVTNPEVTSKCTKVCGESAPMRSWAKMCLVHVFPREQQERAVKMYAINDDQSNRSLAKAEFFRLFGIQSNPSPYLSRT